MNRSGDTLQHTASNAEIVHSLAGNGVEFVLVGGLAVAWYCLERQADDMDLLLNPTSENSGRVSIALTAIGLRGFSADSFTRAGLQVPLKKYFYAELLTPRLEGPSYSEALDGAEKANLFDTLVHVASPTVLIRMKQLALASPEALRDKHVKDIECLRKHLPSA
jgi:hypothetical protein